MHRLYIVIHKCVFGSMFACCLTNCAALAAFSIRNFIRHGTFPEEIKQRFLLNLAQTNVIFWDKCVNIKDTIRWRLRVTWVKACAWAAPPSAGLSEPVRTTPSVNGSKGALIYLQSQLTESNARFVLAKMILSSEILKKDRSCRLVNTI